jgi:hypothetical protein
MTKSNLLGREFEELVEFMRWRPMRMMFLFAETDHGNIYVTWSEN